PAATYKTLIEELADPETTKRDDAAQRLKFIGPPALAAVREAAHLHLHLEVRRRAGLVLQAIERGEILVFGHGSDYWLNRVAFTPDGKHFVSGHYGGKDDDFRVRLWDVDKDKELRSFKGHTRDVTAVLYLPDGRTVLSASMDGTAILWDTETGKEIRRLPYT